jgi:Amidohydrolase family
MDKLPTSVLGAHGGLQTEWFSVSEHAFQRGVPAVRLDRARSALLDKTPKVAGSAVRRMLLGVGFALGGLTSFPISAWLYPVSGLGPHERHWPSRNAPLPLPAEKPAPVAFVNVTVVPMNGEHLRRGQTVVIRDTRIAEIGAASSVKVPSGALRIDGSGKYLMPGLTDAHFHLQGNERDDRQLLQILVANGVTCILNLYGTQSMLDLRERVARGEVLGPTIYTSGPYVSDAPHSQPEADEVERMVVEQKRAGYDLIKTHGDFSRDAFHRLFVVARREQIKVIGHAPRNLGVEPMFEERMDAIAHAEEFIYAYFFFGTPPAVLEGDPGIRRRFLENAEKRIPELATATAKAPMWVVPNLVAYKMIVQQGTDLASVLARPETKYVPPRIAAGWQPGRNRYNRRYSPEIAEHMTWRLALLSKLTAGFRQANVRMMAGTDAPIPGVVPGFSLHDELKLLVAAGLTPYDALRTATANAAEFLGLTGEFGTMTVGARADLLLLDANPLIDVANAARRSGVMVRGRWLAESELRAMLKALSTQFAAQPRE